MKKLGRILLRGLGVLALLLIAAISLTIGWRPFIGPKARPLSAHRFEPTSQRLQRGDYLFNALTGCDGCHSIHDWNTHGAPVAADEHGVGQVMWFSDLPGRVVSPNITPDPETGSGAWSDDQLARAIREGIGHDGRALFPMMPYENFRHMSDEDLASIIVYMRTLKPARHQLPKTEIIFPVKYLIRAAPEPITEPVQPPDITNRVKWGEYLVTMGNCAECHTPMVRGEKIKGLDFAGGFPLNGPWGIVHSANITPDPSGISYYDEATFIQTMRTGYVRARKLTSIMPFGEFKNLTDDDLKAMYAYLRTIKPVQHIVDNTEPPTYCKRCQFWHGGGDKNGDKNNRKN